MRTPIDRLKAVAGEAKQFHRSFTEWKMEIGPSLEEAVEEAIRFGLSPERVQDIVGSDVLSLFGIETNGAPATLTNGHPSPAAAVPAEKVREPPSTKGGGAGA